MLILNPKPISKVQPICAHVQFAYKDHFWFGGSLGVTSASLFYLFIISDWHTAPPTASYRYETTENCTSEIAIQLYSSIVIIELLHYQNTLDWWINVLFCY